ncbi:MAG: hypothetical protein EA382_09845 [Spirochaetaceae bacterium]|nr:MAG: hypothetical protein EA382_09845 [Spirochaetaceae bacterium]
MSNTLAQTQFHRLLCSAIIVFASLHATAQTRATEMDAIVDAALRASPGYTMAVVDAAGRPVVRFADLNGDSHSDVAMIVVGADPRVDPRESTLSQPSRLYQPGSVAALFVLEAFLPATGTLVSVELGRHVVFDGLDIVPLTADETAIGVLARFRSVRGRTSELVVFKHDGGISRFRLSEDRSELGYLRDVTGNGALDAVVSRRVPDAGRGFETFVELFELGRTGYARTATVAVVRELSAFLTQMSLEIAARDWTALGNRLAVRSGDLRSDLERAFRDVTDPDTDGHDVAYDDGFIVDRVVFATIADNPFPEPFLGQTTVMRFRVECCEGENRFYVARIVFRDNPFDGDAFALLTEWESGQ